MSLPTPPPAADEAPFVLARQFRPTRRAMGRRQWYFFLLLFVALGLQLVAVRVGEPTDAVPQVLGWVAFVLVARVFTGFVWLLWSERVLRRNPWVTYRGELVPVTLGGVTVRMGIVLRHEDLDQPVLRVITGFAVRNALPGVPVGAELELWAAGNPARSMAVSATGGAAPRYVRRAWSPLVRRQLSAAASTSAASAPSASA